DQVESVLPEGAVYHKIDPSQYYIPIVHLQNLPFDGAEYKLTADELKKAEKALENVCNGEVAFELKFIGLRFGIDGGVAAVFEDKYLRMQDIRVKLLESCKEACGGKVSRLRDKSFVHITLMRIFSGVEGESLRILKEKARETKDLSSENLSLKVASISLGHETRWTHAGIEQEREYYFGINFYNFITAPEIASPKVSFVEAFGHTRGNHKHDILLELPFRYSHHKLLLTLVMFIILGSSAMAALAIGYLVHPAAGIIAGLTNIYMLWKDMAMPHVRELRDIRYVYLAMKKFNGSKRIEFDPVMINAVERFKRMTGWSVGWTDKESFIEQPYRDSRKLILSLAFGIPDGRRRLAYLQKSVFGAIRQNDRFLKAVYPSRFMKYRRLWSVATAGSLAASGVVWSVLFGGLMFDKIFMQQAPILVRAAYLVSLNIFVFSGFPFMNMFMRRNAERLAGRVIQPKAVKGPKENEDGSSTRLPVDAACTEDGLPLSSEEAAQLRGRLSGSYAFGSAIALTADELGNMLNIQGTTRERAVKYILKYIVRANLLTGPPVKLENGRVILSSNIIIEDQKFIYLAQGICARKLSRTIIHEFGASVGLPHWLNAKLENIAGLFVSDRSKAVSSQTIEQKVYPQPGGALYAHIDRISPVYKRRNNLNAIKKDLRQKISRLEKFGSDTGALNKKFVKAKTLLKFVNAKLQRIEKEALSLSLREEFFRMLAVSREQYLRIFKENPKASARARLEEALRLFNDTIVVFTHPAGTDPEVTKEAQEEIQAVLLQLRDEGALNSFLVEIGLLDSLQDKDLALLSRLSEAIFAESALRPAVDYIYANSKKIEGEDVYRARQILALYGAARSIKKSLIDKFVPLEKEPFFLQLSPAKVTFAAFSVFMLGALIIPSAVAAPAEYRVDSGASIGATAPFGIAHGGNFTPDPKDPRYQSGKDLYYKGEYKLAIEQFQALVSDTAISDAVKARAENFIAQAQMQQDTKIEKAAVKENKKAVISKKQAKRADNIPSGLRQEVSSYEKVYNNYVKLSEQALRLLKKGKIEQACKVQREAMEVFRMAYTLNLDEYSLLEERKAPLTGSNMDISEMQVYGKDYESKQKMQFEKLYSITPFVDAYVKLFNTYNNSNKDSYQNKTAAIQAVIKDMLDESPAAINEFIDAKIARLNGKAGIKVNLEKERLTKLKIENEEYINKVKPEIYNTLSTKVIPWIETEVKRLMESKEALTKKIQEAFNNSSLNKNEIENLIYLSANFNNEGASTLFTFAKIKNWLIGIDIGGDKAGDVLNIINILYGLIEKGEYNVLGAMSAISSFSNLLQNANMEKVNEYGAVLHLKQEVFAKPRGFFGTVTWPIKTVVKGIFRVADIITGPVYDVNWGDIKYFPNIKDGKFILSSDKGFFNQVQPGEAFKNYLTTFLKDHRLYRRYNAVILFSKPQVYSQVRPLLIPGLIVYQQRLTEQEYQMMKPELISYFVDTDMAAQWLDMNWASCQFIWEYRDGKQYLAAVNPMYYSLEDKKAGKFAFETETFLRAINAWTEPGTLQKFSGLEDIVTLERMLSGLIPQDDKSGGWAVSIEPRTNKADVYPSLESCTMAVNIKNKFPELNEANAYTRTEEGIKKAKEANVNPLSQEPEVFVYGLRMDAMHTFMQAGKIGMQKLVYINDKQGPRYRSADSFSKKELKKLLHNKKITAWEEQLCVPQAIIWTLHGSYPIYSDLENQSFWVSAEQVSQDNYYIQFGDVRLDIAKGTWLTWSEEPMLVDKIQGADGKTYTIPGIIDFANMDNIKTEDREALCASCANRAQEISETKEDKTNIEKQAAPPANTQIDAEQQYKDYIARVRQYIWEVGKYLQGELYNSWMRNISEELMRKVEDVKVNLGIKKYLEWMSKQYEVTVREAISWVDENIATGNDNLIAAQQNYQDRLDDALARKADFQAKADYYANLPGHPGYAGDLAYLYGTELMGKVDAEIALLQSLDPSLDECLDLIEARKSVEKWTARKDNWTSLPGSDAWYSDPETVNKAQRDAQWQYASDELTDAQNGVVYYDTKLNTAQTVHMPTLLAELDLLNGPATQSWSVAWLRAIYLQTLSEGHVFNEIDWYPQNARVRYNMALQRQAELATNKSELEAYLATLEGDDANAHTYLEYIQNQLPLNQEYLDWRANSVSNSILIMKRTHVSREETLELMRTINEQIIALKTEHSKLIKVAKELAKEGKVIKELLPYNYVFSEKELMNMTQGRVPSGSAEGFLYDTVLGSSTSVRDLMQVFNRHNIDISVVSVQTDKGSPQSKYILADVRSSGEKWQNFFGIGMNKRYQWQESEPNKGKGILEQGVLLFDNAVYDLKDGKVHVAYAGFMDVSFDRNNQLYIHNIHIKDEISKKMFIDLNAGILSGKISEDSAVVAHDDEGNIVNLPTELLVKETMLTQEFGVGYRFNNNKTLRVFVKHITDDSKWTKADDLLGGVSYGSDFTKWMRFYVEAMQGQYSKGKGYIEFNLPRDINMKVGGKYNQRYDQKGLSVTLELPFSMIQALQVTWDGLWTGDQFNSGLNLRFPLLSKVKERKIGEILDGTGIEFKSYNPQLELFKEFPEGGNNISGSLFERQRIRLWREVLPISHLNEAECEACLYLYDSGVLDIYLANGGEMENVKKSIEIFNSVWQQNKDHFVGFYDSYNILSALPSTTFSGAGPNSWKLNGFAQYIYDTQDAAYLDVAKSTADYLLTLQDNDPSHENTYGALKMFSDATYYSTENNISARRALYNFYQIALVYNLPEADKYRQAYQKIENWLMKTRNNSNGYFYVGYDSYENKWDDKVAADVGLWIRNSFTDEECVKLFGISRDNILKAVEHYCRVTVEYDHPEKGKIQVTGFDFTDAQGRKQTGRKPVVSVEWTLFAGLDFYTGEMEKMMDKDGLLPYANEEGVQTGFGWRTPKGKDGKSVKSLISYLWYSLAKNGENPFTLKKESVGMKADMKQVKKFRPVLVEGPEIFKRQVEDFYLLYLALPQEDRELIYKYIFKPAFNLDIRDGIREAQDYKVLGNSRFGMLFDENGQPRDVTKSMEFFRTVARFIASVENSTYAVEFKSVLEQRSGADISNLKATDLAVVGGLAYSPEIYVSFAWVEYNKKDFSAAIKRIESMINEHPEWQEAAYKQEADAVAKGELPSSTPTQEELTNIYGQNWALYHLGTAQYIRLSSYMELQQADKGKEIMREIMTHYAWAYSWDPQGWLWSVLGGAKDNYPDLYLEIKNELQSEQKKQGAVQELNTSELMTAPAQQENQAASAATCQSGSCQPHHSLAAPVIITKPVKQDGHNNTEEAKPVDQPAPAQSGKEEPVSSSVVQEDLVRQTQSLEQADQLYVEATQAGQDHKKAITALEEALAKLQEVQLENLSSKKKKSERKINDYLSWRKERLAARQRLDEENKKAEQPQDPRASLEEQIRERLEKAEKSLAEFVSDLIVPSVYAAENTPADPRSEELVVLYQKASEFKKMVDVSPYSGEIKKLINKACGIELSSNAKISAWYKKIDEFSNKISASLKAAGVEVKASLLKALSLEPNNFSEDES
ncbi:MAG: hypothetical protein PHJ00_04060, partial [Candidatus Omnitrophica bacterium]|nr:hypothetical protein [Candidatus Omnitrophota bacterium]